MNPTFAKAVAPCSDRYGVCWFETSILSSERYGSRLSGDWRSLPYDGRDRPFMRGSRLAYVDALGVENSVGHYIDLLAAIGGMTLFPIEYLFGALTREVA
jgi:hypothetical protein